MKTWLRTRSGAIIWALVAVLAVRVALNWNTTMLGLRIARPWIRMMVPFELVSHVENTWLEILVIAAAMLFVVWATHADSLRTPALLGVWLLALDLITVLASDTILVAGVRSVIPAGDSERLSWDLLPYDASSLLLWNAVTIGLALGIVALALFWLRRSGRSEASTVKPSD